MDIKLFLKQGAKPLVRACFEALGKYYLGKTPGQEAKDFAFYRHLFVFSLP
jgi:hypothetical protein